MRVSKLSAIFVAAMMILAISGCTTQDNGSPDSASDVVHQIENDGSAIYDDDPIAEEPQLDVGELNGSLENSYGQGEIISAEPHKGSAD